MCNGSGDSEKAHEMLICRAALDSGGTLLVLGLSRENVRRLDDEGQPIRVSRQTHGMAVPDGLTVMLFVGETEASMEAELRQHGLITPETVVNQQQPV